MFVLKQSGLCGVWIYGVVKLVFFSNVSADLVDKGKMRKLRAAGELLGGGFNGASYANIDAFDRNDNIVKAFAARIVFKPDEGLLANGGKTDKLILISNCYSWINGKFYNDSALEISLLHKEGLILISTYTKLPNSSFGMETLKLKYKVRKIIVCIKCTKNYRMFWL